ncbi:MAG: ribonuclease P protein component [Chitinophagales bacterium]|nr:ribonuclease P protein component [Chitinophagales bacterium]
MSLITRLKGRNHIQYVFKEGQVTFVYPLKIVWLLRTETSCRPELALSVWVPKRNIRKAVDRNKIKRRIRAAFNKHEVALTGGLGSESAYDCICIYVAQSMEDFKGIEAAIRKKIF